MNLPTEPGVVEIPSGYTHKNFVYIYKVLAKEYFHSVRYTENYYITWHMYNFNILFIVIS